MSPEDFDRRKTRYPEVRSNVHHVQYGFLVFKHGIQLYRMVKPQSLCSKSELEPSRGFGVFLAYGTGIRNGIDPFSHFSA